MSKSLLLILFLCAAAYAEPLLTFPIGAPTDVPFSDQDLLNVGIEFPQEPGAYFANDSLTVICIPSLLNPAIQECSTKAEANPWVTMGPIYDYVPPPPPIPPVCNRDCGPPVCTRDCTPPTPPSVPEPDYIAFLLLVLLVALIASRLRRNTS